MQPEGSCTRAHPLNTRTPARAREEQAERWAEGLGIISGGLLLRSASPHVFRHDGVITDLQLGVIHRQQTPQPSPRRHAHDAPPQMPAAAKAAALPTRTKSLSSQLHQTLLMEKFSIRMRKPSPPSMQRFVNAAFCPLPPEPAGQAIPLASLWPAH